jgi:hypothetical protein
MGEPIRHPWLGYLGQSIDKRYDPNMDFMTRAGFLIVLCAVFRIRGMDYLLSHLSAIN